MFFKAEKSLTAYIFYGNEGVGKDAAAIEFAKLLNCDEPVNGNEACDKCKNCIEINSFKSSLLKYIIALPSGRNETDDDSNPLEKLDKEDFLNYLNQTEAKDRRQVSQDLHSKSKRHKDFQHPSDKERYLHDGKIRKEKSFHYFKM